MGLVQMGRRNFPLYNIYIYVFFDFLRFSLTLLEDKGKRLQFTATRGISLRPRLHRPRVKLPDQNRKHWEAADLGICPKSESSRMWLGEGGKGLLEPGSLEL